MRERVRRRTGGDAAVLVVDAAVAGAHEEVRAPAASARGSRGARS